MDVLPAFSSDHCPLWIHFKPAFMTSRGGHPFWYEAFWNLVEECGNVINDTWCNGVTDDTHMARVTHR
jgi:hypothetical protein